MTLNFSFVISSFKKHIQWAQGLRRGAEGWGVHENSKTDRRGGCTTLKTLRTTKLHTSNQ